MAIRDNLNEVRASLAEGVTLVAVSKYHPIEALKEAYEAGQRVFGESHVQELVAKHEALPDDIQWHFIGHLQTNKVKYIAPFVSLVHSVDSLKLLKEIDKQAVKCSRVIDCLLQLHIAQEETKFGFDPEDIDTFMQSEELHALKGVKIVGLMAMASNTDDDEQVENEFAQVKDIFDSIKERYYVNAPWFCQLSMGMSGDYPLAMKHGSTLVRVGSKIFGERVYT